jgi:hypothetical protein
VFQLNRNKQKSNRQCDREHIFVFFRKFRVVLFCFGLFRNSSVCFSCFYIGSKHQNPKQTEMFCFWFHETNRNTTETDLVFYVCFGDTLVSYNKDSGRWRGHPLKIARKKDWPYGGRVMIHAVMAHAKNMIPSSRLMDDLFLYLFSLLLSSPPLRLMEFPPGNRGGKNPQASILGKKGGGDMKECIMLIYPLYSIILGSTF